MVKPAVDQARLPRVGLGRRTTLLVFLSTLVLTLVLAGIALYSTYALARQRTDDAHRIALEWSAEHLVSWLHWTQDELEQIGRAEALARQQRSEETPDANATRHLKTSLSASRTFSGLLLLGPEGTPRSWAGAGAEFRTLLAALAMPEPEKANLGELTHSADLRHALTAHTGAAVQALDLGGPTLGLVASTRLSDSQGRLLGSLHGLLQPQGVALQLRADLLDGGGSVYLVAENGRMIGAAGGAPVEAQPPGPHEWLRRGEGDGVHVSWSADVGWVVVSTRPLDVLDWSLVTQQNARDAFGPLVRATPALLVPAVALMLLFTSLASLLGARMSRPFAALYGATRRIAKGDFETQLSPHGAPGELGVLFNAFNTMTSQLREERGRCHAQLNALTEQNQAFQKQHDVLSRLSITDGLTELNNHRFFQDQLGREIKRLKRTGHGLSMLLIDIDDFKQLNDRFGHAAGDEFLKQLAQILRESVRDTDLLARYGGEEFVIVATNTAPQGAVTLAEKLCLKIADSTFIVDATMRPRRMTISIGVASYRQSRTELFASADAALYRAKASGKNCVVFADQDEDAP